MQLHFHFTAQRSKHIPAAVKADSAPQALYLINHKPATATRISHPFNHHGKSCSYPHLHQDTSHPTYEPNRI